MNSDRNYAFSRYDLACAGLVIAIGIVSCIIIAFLFLHFEGVL